MKQDLADANHSPLETRLVDRIVACRLQMAYADFTAARTGEISLTQSNEIRKRQNSAQPPPHQGRRYAGETRRPLGSATMPTAIDEPIIDVGDQAATEEDDQILAKVLPTQSRTIDVEQPEEAVQGGCGSVDDPR